MRAPELGIAALVGARGAEQAQSAPAGLLIGEVEALRESIERLTMRAELSDRFTERTLYAAGAAYAAALAGPGEGDERLAQIACDADRAEAEWKAGLEERPRCAERQLLGRLKPSRICI